MFVDRIAQALWIVGCVGMVMAGCSRGTDSSTADRSANGSKSIATHADNAPATSDTAATTTKKTPGSGSTSLNPAALRSIKKRMATQETDGTTLSLAGITMRVPAVWVAQPVSGASPMAPKAVFRIPNDKGEPGSVRITHFPGMRGKNEQNVQRWIAQARKPNGSPMSQTDAKITSTKLKKVHLTTVDVSGTIKATMRAVAKPGQRMIATIVDHSNGPHFVVAVGDAELIHSSLPTIMSFLKSVRESQ